MNALSAVTPALQKLEFSSGSQAETSWDSLPPTGPVSVEDQGRNGSLDLPKSAAFQHDFLIFGPKFAIEAGEVVLETRHIHLVWEGL